MRSLITRVATIILRTESEWTLIAPLTRFPLLVTIILIAIMHCMLLSVGGYYASAAGLFPHM